jgi:hypothetical protein
VTKKHEPPVLDDILPVYAERAGLGPEHAHDLAVLHQHHAVQVAHDNLRRAAAMDPEAALGYLDDALTKIRAHIAVAAALGHIFDGVATQLGIKVPPGLSRLESLLDALGKKGLPEPEQLPDAG